MKNKGTEQDAQGVKDVEVKAKKKQKASKSYTLKSLGANLRKLQELGLITVEEEKEMEMIRQKAILKYMENEF